MLTLTSPSATPPPAEPLPAPELARLCARLSAALPARLTTSLLLATVLLGGSAGAMDATPDAAAPAARPELDLPDAADVAEHTTYDPAPELQRAPGGSLIVNAFIMAGPVRVEVRDKTSDELLYQRDEDALFPFELSEDDLQAPVQQVRVLIIVRGELAHELELNSGDAR